MESCQRVDVFKTELPPCCIQYYPSDRSIVFISTYKLEETGKKHGSIDIYCQIPQLSLVKRVLTTAVLDLKISNDTIATSHNDGSVILWKFDASELELNQINHFQVFEDTVTSVNFHNLKLIATCTDGQVCSIDLSTGQIEYFATTHDLECWISESGKLGQLSNVIFTGGDDSKLIAHDLRTNDQIWSTLHRHHEAGVVSILSPSINWNHSNPHHLWTGLYDDSLRILDLRVIDRANPELMTGLIPKVEAKINLGGGVWRLIPSPYENDDRVLVCCMYDGARIVDAKTMEMKYFKQDHESMCYGGDWGNNGVMTCSFYDKVVQTWTP